MSLKTSHPTKGLGLLLWDSNWNPKKESNLETPDVQVVTEEAQSCQKLLN